MTFYTTTVYTSCDCPHEEDSHYLIRCGCPNDRTPDHPMYQMEDGFHRIWCSDCLRYCSQPPACPGVTSATRVTSLSAILLQLKGFGRSLITCEVACILR